MFSSKKKRPKQRDPPDAALLSSLSVLYAFIDEHKVPWLYRDCADDKGKSKIVKALAKGTLADDIEQRKVVLEAKACAMAVVECLRSRAPLTSYGLYDSFLDAKTPADIQSLIFDKLDKTAQRGLGDLCAHLSKVWDRNGTTGLTLQQLAHVLAPVLLRRDEQKPERTEAIKRQKCAAQLLTLPWASPKKRDIVTRARGHWSTVKAARRMSSNSNPVARRSLKVPELQRCRKRRLNSERLATPRRPAQAGRGNRSPRMIPNVLGDCYLPEIAHCGAYLRG